jgi:hypothetical protein
MKRIDERIDKYLIEEANDTVNLVEKLIEFIMKLNVNKLPNEQAAELSGILDMILGVSEDGPDISFRISKSKLKMLAKKYKRTSMGKKLDKKASKINTEEGWEE